MPRWAILGTSFISHTVAASIQGSPNSSITAVFGRDAGRLQAFADKFSIPNRYSTIEEVLDDGNVDVVYIGLPSHLHADAAIAAAKKGKAILSEKSLTTTMEDAHKLIDAVRSSGVFFVEGIMYLSHPLMAKVAEIIRSDALGPIRGVSGYYAANIWDKANPLGKGTIYNLGCYPVSLLHWAVQTAYGKDAIKSRKISGLGNLAPDGSHVRDASLSIRLANGVVGSIQSTDSFGNDYSFAIQGEKAVLRFKTNPWLPPAGDSIMEVRTYAGGKVEEIVVSSELDAFGHQVKRVEECLAAGVTETSRPAPTWEDSIEIMELLTEWEKAVMDSNDRVVDSSADDGPTADPEGIEDAISSLSIVRYFRSHVAAGELHLEPAKFKEFRLHSNLQAADHSAHLVSGSLFGPSKLPIPPRLFIQANPVCRIVAVGCIGSRLYGHPGYVHGGVLFALFDDVFARCAAMVLPSGVGMTANLNIDFRKPSMPDRLYIVRAEVVRYEGRKVWVNGSIRCLAPEAGHQLRDDEPATNAEDLSLEEVEGELVAEATSLFIEPKFAHSVEPMFRGH
ncbi:D-xylose 1-dehydrogenase (NADP(+)) 2 [Paramyrothecium foliicola]|nr:D-xylose 1-dehydrogenase (NADP(+)) 2 [Paramyrothecium foliicola]